MVATLVSELARVSFILLAVAFRFSKTSLLQLSINKSVYLTLTLLSQQFELPDLFTELFSMVIGLSILRHFLNQSDVKLKAKLDWF